MAPPNVKIKHITRSPSSSSSGDTRFPKLDECAHFHYENVELGPIKVLLCDKATETNKLASVCSSSANKENEVDRLCFLITVISNSRKWMVRRSYKNFMFLDTQLHRCVYDRKYSLLKELSNISSEEFDNEDFEEKIRTLLSEYLERFSQLAGSLINCGPVLNWFELDNRGNRLIVTDEVAINTPAVAAAYVVVPYIAQATDEISFDVGDMISVIDMPPPEESSWWRGKKGFEVGFFPSECVEVIGDKVPHAFKLSNASTKPVFRRHGKLIAFFRSFLLSRPSRRKLKQSGILKERVFGCDLGEHLLNTGREIPMVLKCCAEFIEEYGVVDGIYRLSGVSSNIQRLRLAFDEDRPLNLGDPATVHDIHSVASLLKMYFRELPNPLLTYQLYDKFVSAVQSCEEDVKLLRVRDVVQQLPPPHFRTLQYLLRHLAKVASFGEQTGMTPKNIAIVWAPNLLRSRDVENGGVGALHVVGVQAVLTEYLIRFCDLIFDEKVPSVPSSEQSEGFMIKARPKSLAISTPTKLLSLEEARARALSTHLPLTQQKYIEVGGGPDKLPSKYHTVIDLPMGKQGLPKLKKSPSGWKSFFSRGWYSGSTRDKSRHAFRTSRKASTGSLPHPSGYLQEKETSETDAPFGHRKKLRTVKSAESLVHCLKDSLHDTSKQEKGGSSHKSSPQVSVDSSCSSEVISPLSKSPGLQKHTRSSSHESYFESSSMDIISEPSFEDDEHGLFYYVNEQMQMLQNSSSLPWHSDNIKQITSENLNENEMEGISEDTSVETEKSSRKQKSTAVSDAADAKVQRLNEASSDTVDDSPNVNFQTENSSDNIINDMSFSPDDEIDTYKTSCKDSSPTVTQNPNTSEFYYTDESLMIDPILLYDAILNKRSSIISSSDTDTDVNNKTIVERYGNAETVLVEVHATQDSSSEEEQCITFIDECSKVKNEIGLSDKVVGESNLVASDISDALLEKGSESPDSPVESPLLKSHSPMLFDDAHEVSVVKDETPLELSETASSSTEISDEDDHFDNSNAEEVPVTVVERVSSVKDVISDEFKNIRFRKDHSKMIFEEHSQSLHTSKNEEVKDAPLRSRSEESDVCHSLSINTPPSPVYPPKSLKLQDFQSLKAKLETIPAHKKKHIFIPSPSSPVEEVRKKFELHASNSNKMSESPVSDIKPRPHLKDWTSKSKKSFEIQESASLSNLDSEKLAPSPVNRPEKLPHEIPSTVKRQEKLAHEIPSPVERQEKLAHEIPSPVERQEKLAHEIPSSVERQEKLAHEIPSPVERQEKLAHEIPSPAERPSLSKRHSEPPPKTDILSPTDVPKRMSNKYESEISQVPKSAEKTSKSKAQQPSLFTQLKIRKLQSLQAEVTGPPPEPIDPWSDPILDMQEDYHPLIYSPSHINTSASDENTSISEVKSVEDAGEIPLHSENFDENVPVQSHTQETPPVEIETKMDVVSDIQITETKNSNPSVTLVDSHQVTSKQDTVPESEAVKRERINRIKEERRAQLREKLKPESFRLEAEEKEKIQTKFRLRKDCCRYGSTEDNSKDVKKSDKAVETDSADITETGTNCDLSAISDESSPKTKSNDRLSESGISTKSTKDVSKMSEDCGHQKTKKSSHSYDDRKWLSMPPSDIRDKVAMFERSKETKELCRLGPNGKFIQKQSPSALTSSFVR